MIRGHGGDIYDLAQNMGCSPNDIIDMSNNTNPLGLPPGLPAYLKENLGVINAHPEVDSKGLVKAFAAHHTVRENRVLAGNGTTQFIYTLPLTMETKKALIAGPTYADYADTCRMYGISYEYMMAKEEDLFQPHVKDMSACLEGIDTVFICNPNNPTGNLISRKDLLALCGAYPGIRFLIDESYLPFTDRYDETTMITTDLSNVIVLSSYSKCFRIPGLRLGFLIAPPEIIEQCKRFYQPWSVNSLAQIAGRYVLNQTLKDDGFLTETRSFVAGERHLFTERLKDVELLKIFPSMTSFVLLRIKGRFDAPQLCSIMANNRILIRNCSNFEGLSDNFVRISLRGQKINALVANKLREIFA